MLIPLRYPLAALVWSVVLPLRPIFLCYPVPSDRNNSSSFPRNASQRAAEFSPSLLFLPHGSLHAAQGRSVRGFNSRKTDRRRAGLSTGFRTDDPDTLPSYLGKAAKVNWMLSAKADIPLGGDLEQDVYPIVVNPFRRQPVDVAFENQEVSPRIRLELSSNVYQPGETLEGKLTLLEGGNLRAVRLQLFLLEQAAGHGKVIGTTSGSSVENTQMGETFEWPRDNLLAAREVPFRIPLSPQTPCSYTGKYSSTEW